MLKFNNSGIRMTDCLSASKKPHLPEILSPSSRQNKSIPKINHLNTKKTKKEKNQTFLRFFLAFFAIKMIYLWNWLKKIKKNCGTEKTTCTAISHLPCRKNHLQEVIETERLLRSLICSSGWNELTWVRQQHRRLRAELWFFQLLLWQRLLWRVWVRLQRGL